MTSIEEIKGTLRKLKPLLKELYGVTEIGVFGSHLRGEQKDKSDLDILVEFEKSMGLFKFVELENYLSEKIGVKVDLVMKSALKPRIGKRILGEVVNI